MNDAQEDQGVYVSLDTLLDLRHGVYARSTKSIARVQRGLPGEIASNQKGPGIEFEDIRPYMPGDDLRHIDWRVAARTGMPFTRLYTEDRERSVMIVCDQRANMFFGSGAYFKSYRASVTAAKIAWFSVQQNHRISGVIAAESLLHVTNSNPRRAALLLCGRLAEQNRSLNAGSQELVSLDEILDDISSTMQSGMIVTIISDFNDLDNKSASVLAAIAKRGALMLHHVIDPLESRMSVSGSVGISDGSDMVQVVVNAAVRQAYQIKYAAVVQGLEEIAAKSGATLIDTDGL